MGGVMVTPCCLQTLGRGDETEDNPAPTVCPITTINSQVMALPFHREKSIRDRPIAAWQSLSCLHLTAFCQLEHSKAEKARAAEVHSHQTGRLRGGVEGPLGWPCQGGRPGHLHRLTRGPSLAEKNEAKQLVSR